MSAAKAALVGLFRLGGPAQAQMNAIESVETPMGLARVGGSVNSPSFERLVIGDRTVVELDPAGALQRVWIKAEIGTLLLVGMTTVGNGCFGEYVWVHTGP